MAVRGDIFYHKEFELHSGGSGEKLILLLNTPGANEPYLFVKPTSQTTNKPYRSGCIEKQQLFFVPAKTTFFEKDTWIELYELYEILPVNIDNNPKIPHVGSLSEKLIADIVDCLLLCREDDISPAQKQLLQPPLQESIKKLKELFKKMR